MQTKIGSLKESLTNIAIGFGVALLAQLLIFPLFGFNPPLLDNIAIGALFTAVSLARSYVIRRWFNRSSQISYAQLKNEVEKITNEKREIIELIKNDLFASRHYSIKQYRNAIISNSEKITNAKTTSNRSSDIKIDDELLPEFRSITEEA